MPAKIIVFSRLTKSFSYSAVFVAVMAGGSERRTRRETTTQVYFEHRPSQTERDRRNTEATPKQHRTNPDTPTHNPHRERRKGGRRERPWAGYGHARGERPRSERPPPDEATAKKRGVFCFIVVVWPTISTAAGQANSRKKPLYGRTGTSPSPRCGSLHDPTTASDKDKHRPATENTPQETPRDSQQNPTKGGHTTTPPHKKPHPPRRASKRPEWLSAPSTATHPHPWRHQKPANGDPQSVLSSRDPTLIRGRSRGGRGA